jgi:hypothetical protein
MSRLLIRGAVFVFGTAIGGPALGYALQKGASLAMGNPFAAIPGSSLMDAGLDIAALDGWGNPSDTDIHGNRPSDIHGGATGTDVHGKLPSDIWGRS